MSTISLSLEGAQGVSAAIAQLSQSVETLAQRQAANTRATASAARANAQAAGAARGFAQDAQGVAQRVGQLGQQLERLGGQAGRVGGAFTTVSHAVSAFATATGPAGIAIAGITTAVSAMGAAFAAQDAALSAARTRVESLTTSYSDLVSEINAANSAMTLRSRLEAGSGSAVENEAWIREAANRRDLMALAVSGDVGALATLRDEGVTGRANTAPGLGARITGALADLASGAAPGSTAVASPIDDSERRVLEAAIASLNREIVDRSAIAGGGEARAGVAAMGGQDRPGGGGGGGVPRIEELQAIYDAWDDEREAAYAEAELDEKRHAAELEAIVREKLDYLHDIEAEARDRDRVADEADWDAWVERRRAAEEAALDASREYARAHSEVLAESTEALAAFADSGSASIDQIVARWTEYNTVAKAAGVDTLTVGNLLERTMSSTADSIVDTVGNQMTGAFRQAVGAWLDGSKSFVEAAEAMAKGVIKALVTEAIVQGVTETARGIADLASGISSNNAQMYASSSAHFAAAAAWGAVAGIAGGIGAATGAFGGGGGGGARGASQHDMADADRERQRAREAGPTVVNLYYDGLPTTQQEVAAGVYRGLRNAQRHGFLPAGMIGPGR